VTAAAVMTILMMVILLPAMLLDVLATQNISLTVTVLLVGIYLTEPLQFSIFPSLLRLMTLFRLGIRVSAMRLILMQGVAGNGIRALGQFVVGENVVIGLVMFLVLAPNVVEALLRAVATEMESMASRGNQPLLVCSPQLR
jgi:flagellar biosynthesis protein FlhA